MSFNQLHKTEYDHLVRLLSKTSTNDIPVSLPNEIEFEVFKRSFLHFLLVHPNTHFLKFILDRAIESLRVSNFEKAEMYTN